MFCNYQRLVSTVKHDWVSMSIWEDVIQFWIAHDWWVDIYKWYKDEVRNEIWQKHYSIRCNKKTNQWDRCRVVRCHEMGGCGVNINILKLTVLVIWYHFHSVKGSTLQMACVSTCHDQSVSAPVETIESLVSMSPFPVIMSCFSVIIDINIFPNSPVDFHFVSSRALGFEIGIPVPQKSL